MNVGRAGIPEVSVHPSLSRVGRFEWVGSGVSAESMWGTSAWLDSPLATAWSTCVVASGGPLSAGFAVSDGVREVVMSDEACGRGQGVGL